MMLVHFNAMKSAVITSRSSLLINDGVALIVAAKKVAIARYASAFVTPFVHP